MSFSLSVNAVLAMNSSSDLNSDEKQALKRLLFVSSCYLKLHSENATLSASEIEYLQCILEQEKPKKEIRKIKPSPQIKAISAPVNSEIIASLELNPLPALVLPTPTPAPAPAPAPTPAPTPTPASGKARKYRIDVPNEGKCRARRYGPHIPNTKPKVYYEQQCNNKPEGEQNLCKTCQKYYNNKDDKDSHKRREWNGFVCDVIPDHTAIVGGKWFQKKFPKGLAEEPVVSTPPIIEHVSSNLLETPKEPIEESIAEENTPAVTEEWRPWTLNGVFYAINIKNNKVYKADMTKSTGKEMVMLEQYCGVFENGTINAYVDEEDIDE